MEKLPARITSVPELEELLSRPPPGVVEDLGDLGGDLVVLGAGGKMGPSLVRMARRAVELAGSSSRVIAVARFARRGLREALEAAGVRTVACDLLDRDAVVRLPDAAAVVLMAGVKFGTDAAPSTTWALNAWLPALVAERYRGLPTVVFSSGNVYPFVPVEGGGAREATPPAPVGEYAWSVLARERIFEHASLKWGTPALLLRLSYAAELRYGVPLDIALKIQAGAPIDLAMGHVNVLWQGDASAAALRSLRLARSPPNVLNVTGLETLSIRHLARELGRRLGRDPVFSGVEEPTALLADATRACDLFGPPVVSAGRLVEWVADWVGRGGTTIESPTHYETRNGRF